MKNMCMITHELKEGDGQGRVKHEILLVAHSAGYAITVLVIAARDFALKLSWRVISKNYVGILWSYYRWYEATVIGRLWLR